MRIGGLSSSTTQTCKCTSFCWFFSVSLSLVVSLTTFKPKESQKFDQISQKVDQSSRVQRSFQNDLVKRGLNELVWFHGGHGTDNAVTNTLFVVHSVSGVWLIFSSSLTRQQKSEIYQNHISSSYRKQHNGPLIQTAANQVTNHHRRTTRRILILVFIHARAHSSSLEGRSENQQASHSDA